MTDVSVIIVNWNTRQLLADCLDSLIKTADGLSLEYIVVDNGSTDGSQAMLAEQYPQVRLMANQENVGFGRANNQGDGWGTGRYALLFNSDALATPGFLQRLVALADANPKVGMVGAHLLNQDGSFQASHTRFPTLWREFLILSGLGRKLYGYYFPSHGPDEAKGQQKSGLCGRACMLVRLEAYRQARWL
ncbi:MAG: glycosyltransferase family 2 protein [Chloroflexi bacterium]|nr:glycosyltransferase family 2 protein [Chloroflexota bacterium]